MNKLSLIVILLILLVGFGHAQNNTKDIIGEKSEEYSNLANDAIFGSFSGAARTVLKAALPFIVIITGTIAVLSFTRRTFDSEKHTTEQKQSNVFWIAMFFLLAIFIAAYISKIL